MMIGKAKFGHTFAALTGLFLIAASGTTVVEAKTAPDSFETIEIPHALGVTVLQDRPERVVALDMNELDFLDQLGVPVVGLPKDFVPHFLSAYGEDPDVADVGAIVKPNVERIYGLKPDLVLMTALQAKHYKEITAFSPVLHYDIDYRQSGSDHIETVKKHAMTLGRIFGKEEVAAQKVAGLDARIEELRNIAQSRPERALVIMHNNGAFSSFGAGSRYGFVFHALGVKPANEAQETGLHGQPVTSEFIQAADPDIIFIIDRTSVMRRQTVLTAAEIENPLLKETKAWKSDRVVFVDPDAWYVTAASITPLEIIVAEVLSAYQKPVVR
ncbi:siderophore ABC transporter substrate-binding protein [Nisaea sp.]|uniref:siderophore ABC transporter substrate-binding protein n=1 Tax=Nisaea sp. TaxID=2024842 RepID=UPI00329A68DD